MGVCDENGPWAKRWCWVGGSGVRLAGWNLSGVARRGSDVWLSRELMRGKEVTCGYEGAGDKGLDGRARKRATLRAACGAACGMGWAGG